MSRTGSRPDGPQARSQGKPATSGLSFSRQAAWNGETTGSSLLATLPAEAARDQDPRSPPCKVGFFGYKR